MIAQNQNYGNGPNHQPIIYSNVNSNSYQYPQPNGYNNVYNTSAVYNPSAVNSNYVYPPPQMQQNPYNISQPAFNNSKIDKEPVQNVGINPYVV